MLAVGVDKLSATEREVAAWQDVLGKTRRVTMILQGMAFHIRAGIP